MGMPSMELKSREEALQSLLKKIDADSDTFSALAEKLHKKKAKLAQTLNDAGLEPIPIKLSAEKTEDILEEVETHILELNKLKNLISMRLKRILQEEDLEEKLEKKFGKNVVLKRTSRGLLEVEIEDDETLEAKDLLQESKKKVDSLRNQIHSLAGDE